MFLWSEVLGYYLLPQSSITWDSISEVIFGEKQLLKLSSLGETSAIPKVKDLQIRNYRTGSVR